VLESKAYWSPKLQLWTAARVQSLLESKALALDGSAKSEGLHYNSFILKGFKHFNSHTSDQSHTLSENQIIMNCVRG
jgi:hypothetical protein